MQARGLLMVEHRLIERMISLLEEALRNIESSGKVDASFIDEVVDFIRTYADRTHHGKEEDILFKDLRGRDLSAEDLEMLNGLVEDHRRARDATGALADANDRHRNGDASAVESIARQLRALVVLYPPHIEKEDKVFFAAARAYFTEEEDRAMLAAFLEFDRRVIHDKYRGVVEKREAESRKT